MASRSLSRFGVRGAGLFSLTRLGGLLADRGAVGLLEWAGVSVWFFHGVGPKTGDTPSPWGRDLRLVPTGANRQPALAVYAPAGDGNSYQPFAIKVLTVNGGLIAAITGFVHPGLFGRFGLPPHLPAAAGR